MYYMGVFFSDKAEKKNTAKCTHSLHFWDFYAKSIFSREIKKYDTFAERYKKLTKYVSKFTKKLLLIDLF